MCGAVLQCVCGWVWGRAAGRRASTATYSTYLQHNLQRARRRRRLACLLASFLFVCSCSYYCYCRCSDSTYIQARTHARTYATPTYSTYRARSITAQRRGVAGEGRRMTEAKRKKDGGRRTEGWRAEDEERKEQEGGAANAQSAMDTARLERDGEGVGRADCPASWLWACGMGWHGKRGWGAVPSCRQKMEGCGGGGGLVAGSLPLYVLYCTWVPAYVGVCMCMFCVCVPTYGCGAVLLFQGAQSACVRGCHGVW
ncbi:uncharacterized protein K452DRAFT_116585 [Aplosporella prunicola CBS 121167]|uniref:Uncharacterized protein n=1 Tax=Aplosporella prunicola CBS 121167 TaxID=1176127 RepID=A0A6A6B015_9PEZI|nr:uncharacterized protein K452DRAFT_116585 [Aplosporella prunicola CBS 121167]KAF2136878.1 hypothetical protein K452DRAFT_116585 [Aplosporella prunicola CBS 121167]